MDEEMKVNFQIAKYDRNLLTGPVLEEQQSHTLKWHALMRGGVLNRADLALQIGELFAANVYCEETMAQQRPFEIRDDGDRWIVFGSYNRDMMPGTGPLKVVLRKWDGAVLEIATPLIYSVEGEEPTEEEKALPRVERFLDWLAHKARP